MAQIHIKSVENLLVFMAFAGSSQALWDQVDVDGLSAIVPLAVKGPNRDGRIDIYGATFVADLQRQMYKSFAKYGGIPAGGRDKQLRVAVVNGSDWLKIDFSPALKEAVRKVPAKYLVGTVCFGAVLAAGVYCYGYFQEAETERIRAEVEMARMEHAEKMQRLEHEHYERLVSQLAKDHKEIVSEAIGLATLVAAQESQHGNDASKPVRKYVKTMRRNEVLHSGEGERYTKREALKRLVPLPVAEVMYYVHADGNYSLHGIDLLEGTQGLRVAQEEGQTTAFLERLDADIREHIVATVDQSMEMKTVIGMDLQVDVYFTQKGIHHAVVIGVGKPRPKMQHWHLSNIPEDVPEKDRLLQGE